MSVGGVPILTAGLKWQPLGMSAVDAQAVESYKMSVDDIARIFRMPPFMIGDYSKATYSNTEVMARTFYVSCLGFYLEHIEAALNRLFGFSTNETSEFDIESGLLRGEFRERMEAYARGIQGGVLAPNEARRRENLPPVDGGDRVLVQQQMIPVDQAGTESEAESEPAEETQRSDDDETDRAYSMISRAAA
jgi:HK97 family phage portal protein